MSRRLIVRPEAEADLAEAADWYEKRKFGLGEKLTAEIGAVIQRAVERPTSHLRLRERPEVRRVLARRFPYRVFFIVRTDSIVVFAILHTARHDRQWKGRI